LVNKTAFIYLTAFSRTGGIEQFNKNVLASFKESGLDAYSVYDHEADGKYFNKQSFKGFNGNKLACLMSLIWNAKKYSTILIGHINLAPLAYLIKLLYPSKQLILFAHGIEVWKPLVGSKAWLVKNTSAIYSVSNFTKTTLLANNPVLASDKIRILPNALDPFFDYPTELEKPTYLLNRYGIQPDEKLILTVSRLSSDEQYKGYDIVIKILKELNNDQSILKYIIAGNADEKELTRVKQLIQEEGLSDKVILTGFVKEQELIDHYLVADIFVLPSKGEGFGIVLIEALACGRKVIAGNKDGSVDALKNGELGTLVDPDNLDQLKLAINNLLNDSTFDHLAMQVRARQNYSFERFKNNLLQINTA
jgi:glycosyltransferase involved in cell wall biosynthesis